MERINANEVQSMMEAYASVYKTEEQETLSEGYGKDCVKKEKKTKHNCAKKVCSEQWGEGTCIPEQHTLLDDGTVTHYDVMFEHGVEKMVPVEELDILVTEMHEHAAMEGEELQENQAANRARQQRLRQQQNANRPEPKPGPVQTFRDRIFARRSASPAARANTNRYGQNIKVGPITGPAQNQQLKKPAPAQKPPTAQERAYGPKSTLNPDQQKVNREYDRLRQSGDMEAAEVYGKKMAAKGAANSDFKLEKPTQAQSNPTAAQKQARVDAAIARVNRPENLNKPAPVGSALRAQQDAKAAAAAPVVKKKPRPGARNRMRMEELDVFDTIKEYLIGEGATEEEALKQMLQLTDEQRTEILEGSCGSKPKKKGGYKK